MPGAHGAGKAVRRPAADPVRRWPASWSSNMASAIASGGGRELLSRDQAVAVPDQPDHRPPRRPAAGAAQHRLDDPGLDPARVDGLRYAPAQAVPGPGRDAALAGLLHHARPGRGLDDGGVRRGPYGIAITRGLLVCLGAGRGVVQLTGHTHRPARPDPDPVVLPGRGQRLGRRAGGSWSRVLLVGSLVAVVLGAVPAHLAARRMPRDEARMETDQHEPRPMPAHRPRDPGPHRPGLGLALGADAPRRARARRRPRPGRDLRQPAVGADDDPPGPGRLRWGAAVRRQRLVPRRPRRPVAREPPGARRRRCSTPGRWCSPSSSASPR